jgi:hypothetical protein
MRYFWLLTLVWWPAGSLTAQVFLADDFNRPSLGSAWTGSSASGLNVPGFTVTAGRLQSSPGSGGSGNRWAYLTTPLSLNLNTQPIDWSFDVQLNFTSPDNNNRARVNLASTNPNLQASLQGYFVQIQDRVSLWRQTNTTATEILLSGGQTTTPVTPNNLKIRVIRLTTGRWYLFVNDVFQGRGEDATHASSSHFGVQYFYSAGARQGSFFFDGLVIKRYVDSQPPVLIVRRVLDPPQNNALYLKFNEPIDSADLSDLSKYSLGSFFQLVNISRLPASDSAVILRFAQPLPTDGSSLSVNSIRDLLGNQLDQQNFRYPFTDSLPPRPATAFVINVNTVDLLFDEAIQATGVNDAAYTLSGGTNLPNVSGGVRDTRDHRRVRLLFDSELPENRLLTLTIKSKNSQTGIRDSVGNLLTEAEFHFERDTRRPTIASLELEPPNQVKLVFSENLDPVTARLVNNFTLNGGTFRDASPQSVGLQGRTLTLTFAQPFQEGQAYTLRVAQVQDLSRNPMTTRTLAFVYDTDPPRIVSVQAWNWANKRQLRVRFSEPVQLNQDSIWLTTPGNRKISLDAAPTACLGDTTYLLQFANALPDSALALQIKGLRDQANNASTSSLGFSLATPQLAYVRASNEREVLVDFSEKITAGATVLTNYSVGGLGQPDSAFIVPNSDDAQVRLRFPANLRPGQAYTLTVGRVSGVGNLPSTNLSARFVYDPKVSAVFAESNNQVDVIFSFPLNNLPPAGSFSLAPNNQALAAVRLNDDPSLTNRKFRLLFDADFSDARPRTLRLGGYGLGCEDSVPRSSHLFTFDNIAPRVEKVQVLSPTEMVVFFNKALHHPNAEAVNTYQVVGLGRPLLADLADNQREVRLQLPQRLGPGVYTLRVSNLRDASQRNLLVSQDFAFSRPTQPKPGELRISELLPDPNPRVKLPEVEFVEVLNPTQQAFQLLGLRLADATGQTRLGEYTLLAGEQVVLCPIAAVDSFKLLTNKVLGLSPWPSLANTGERLRLLDLDSALVDEVTYSSAWYPDPVKRAGGWSLELRDPASACAGASNWAASTDSLGGTPGRRNSVAGPNPDRTPPRFAASNLLDGRTLLVKFTEELDSLTLTNRNFYTSSEIPLASLTYQSPTEVRLNFANQLDSIRVYRLLLNGMRDCAGNAGRDTLVFGLGRRALPQDLVISEIMANETLPADDTVNRRFPRRLPAAEYMEIYNRSDKPINLGRLEIGDASGAARLPNRLLLPGQYLAFCPTSRASLFRVPNVLGLAGFPSLSNSGERLYIGDTSGYVVHAVDYRDTWYQDEQKRRGGWSLELIDSDNFCALAENWRASADSSGGTPGRANSVRGRLRDDVRPQVSGWSLRSDRQIEVNFSKNLDTLLLKQPQFYQLNNGASVREVVLQGPQRVWLNLAQPLSTRFTYTLQISNLRDCAGNLLQPFSATFGTGRLPAKNELRLTEIMANDQPGSGSPPRNPALPAGEYVEIFNSTADLLTLNGLRLADATSAANLPNTFLGPGQYAVLCATSRADSFQRHLPDVRVIGVPGFPSLANAGEALSLRLAATSEILASVNYADQWYTDPAKRNGGWALEVIDPANLCGEEQNWDGSIDPSGGTPGRINSLFRANPDTVPPQLTEVRLLNENNRQVLLIGFSERMDSLSLQSLANYQTSPSVPLRVVEWINDRTVRLSFAELLVADSLYQLRVVGVRDCAGNPIRAQNTANFGTGAEPGPNELLITEIMADPSPAVGLPEREYVEIFNPTSRFLFLGNVRLVDDGNETQGGIRLPPVGLRPGEYAILGAPATTADLLRLFSTRRVISLAGFPSLANSGETLTLRNSITVLFSVTYSDQWLELTKRNGGWALEMIDPANPCGEANNWAASSAPAGGTPGAANSVARPNPDREPPSIVRVEAISPTQIQVWFSEKMDSLTATNRENYQLSNNLAVSQLSLHNQREIILQLREPMAAQLQYILLVRGVRDCAGNVVAEQRWPLGLGTSPLRHELLLTEIMADPAPPINLPESEYLEIYNASDKVINLGLVWLWVGHEAPRPTRLPSTILLPREYAVLCPNSSVAVFQARLTNTKIIGLPNWLGLANEGERLVLRTGSSLLVHEVTYSDRWYKDQEKMDGGWSLELRDLTNPCAGSDNWEASQDRNGGTPGRPNSLRGTVPDNRPPQLLRADVVDSVTIRLRFDEKLDSASVLAASFTLSNNILVRSISFDLRQPEVVVLGLAQPLIARTRYTLVARNVRDCGGNPLLASSPISLVLPERGLPGDVLINEILFNPTVGGVDFVEIYNTSDKYIDLKNWQVANARPDQTRTITTETWVMPPRSYAVLTPSLNQLKSQYSQVVDSLVIVVPSLPSFNDDAGMATLLNDRGQRIDQFEYNEQMHFALLDNEEGVSLERLSFSAPTNDRNNWHSAAAPHYGTPTRPNSQALVAAASSPFGSQNCFRLENEIFTPDGDGLQDVLLLHFDCAGQGVVATVRIFDVQGRLARTLINQQTVAQGAFYAWDGVTDSGDKARVGYYVLQIEQFDLNGQVQRTQLKAVVGAKF